MKNSINEASRTELINKSRKADTYKNSKENRWTAKSKCKVANTVKEYNQIDMNTFWKEDKLKFGVKVQGETNTYTVKILFNNILDRIKTKVQQNNNLLTYNLIYRALVESLGSTDIYIGCSCPDFKYRLNYYANKNSHATDKEDRPSNITNPNDTKGAACKHILAVLNNLEWLKKIASVINNYINYMKENMENNYGKFIFPKIYGLDYNKAIQMTLDDYDSEGNEKDFLDSDESFINLSNAIGKERGKFKKKN